MTGLPAMTTSARIRPSPGVAISSARQDTGYWPSTSGAPRTRLVQRLKPQPSAWSGGRTVTIDQLAGLANIEPPGRSRFPVRMLSTSTSQEARVPNSWLQVPMRP